MNCLVCGNETKVIDVRSRNEKRYRRRECTSCGERFTTYEHNQQSILDMLDKYLPVGLVDQVAAVLEMEMPERDRKKLFNEGRFK